MSFLIALLGLGFLIFFHELGHFIAAKLCGVAVLEFSIGMGPRLFSFVWRNTRYSIKLLPLGGSCAMLGEDAAGSGDFLKATGKECLKDESDPTAAQTVIDYDGVQFSKEDLPKYTFQGKSAGKRFFICIAGVLNNFIIAFIMAAVLIHFAGFDPLYVVGTESNAPASSIGLAPGDRVTGINYQGKRIKSMPSYRSLYIWKYLNTPDFNENTVLTIRYQHNGHTMLSDFKPYYSEDQKTYNLGILFYGGRLMPETIPEYLSEICSEVQYNVNIVFESFKMIQKGRVSRNEVMGPVGTVAVIGTTVEQSSKYGIFNAFLVFLQLLIMISANLAIMNLLPIPGLDGGRLLFILLEMISRRCLNPKIEEKINAAGMILLLIVMALILSNDIWNVISGAYKEILGG